MNKLADVQAISADMEADFLRSFTQHAKDCLDQLKEDAVSPGRIAQVEEALSEIRDQGIARIRTSVLLGLAAHNARVSQ